MALLTFPFPVADGTVYPVSPPAGTNVYQWSSTDQTWILLGKSTGVAAGTYGTPLSVPQITIDATGRITVAVDVPIQLGDTTQVGLVQLVDDLISNDPTKALTAAQGFVLSNEIGDTSLLNPFYPNLVTAINALGAPSGVTAGTYGNSTNVGRFTVNAQGRITSATNVPLALATAISPGVVRVGANLSVTPTGVLSVPNSSTAQRGVVQLVNDTVTNDNTKALTAAQGYDLQLQIDALEARNNLTFAGTIDGATGLMLTVTAQGTALGFVVGAALPLPSVLNDEYFVVVTVPGTFTPTGGAPQATNDGDWFVSDGSQWLYYNVGPTVAAATFIQLDDISGQFNNTRVSFVLRVSGTAYTPVSASAILLSVGGVIQIPGASFTLAGSTVTFTEAPKTNTTFVGYAVSGLTGGGGGGGGGGTGTVTSVATGPGLIGGPITTTGTISLRPATTSTLGGVQPDGTTITVSPTGVISASSAGVGTLQSVTNNGATTTNAINVGGFSSTGNMVFGDSSSDTISVPARFASSLIPSATEVYDLGSATNRWRDLYVSSNSIYMGTNQLTVSGGQLLLNGNPVGGGGGSVAGANGEIQFNNNGVFGASANLTWDGTELYANNVGTKLLAVSDSRNATNGAFLFGTTGTGFGQSYIYNFYANRAFDILTTDTSPISFRNASSSTPFLARLLPGGAAELYHNGSKKFETAAAGANVTGNLEATGNLKTRAALQVSNNAQPSFVTGFQAPLAFTQSVVYRLPSGDGAPGNVLSTNGSGLLSWVSPGSATAGGSNTQIQFNSSGTLAGSSSLTWNGSTLSVPSISFTGQVSSTSGYFWKGMNPATLSGSSNGAAMGYGNFGFQRYSTSASDVALIASYQPTSVDTVLLTVGGDFYLRDLSGNNEFTVTGAGNVFIKGSLQASGLNYPTADGTSGQVLTTDGAGNLSWASGSGAVSTLQQVTTAGNTTTNTIRLFDSVTTNEAITLDPQVGLISILPQAIGEPGFYVSSTGPYFGNSSGSFYAGGLVPASLTFNGSLGTSLKTASPTVPVQLWAGGQGGVTIPQVSVTGTTTTVNNNLQVEGYIQATPNGIRFYESSAVDYVGLNAPSSLSASYNLTLPPADGTADQVLATDGTGDLQWLTTAKIVAVPASSASGGATGQIAFGNGFFYWFNTATNQWLRVAGSTF